MNEIHAWQFGGQLLRDGYPIDAAIRLPYMTVVALGGPPVVRALDVLGRQLFTLWVRQGYADHAAESRS